MRIRCVSGCRRIGRDIGALPVVMTSCYLYRSGCIFNRHQNLFPHPNTYKHPSPNEAKYGRGICDRLLHHAVLSKV